MEGARPTCRRKQSRYTVSNMNVRAFRRDELFCLETTSARDVEENQRTGSFLSCLLNSRRTFALFFLAHEVAPVPFFARSFVYFLLIFCFRFESFFSAYFRDLHSVRFTNFEHEFLALLQSRMIQLIQLIEFLLRKDWNLILYFKQLIAFS